MNPTRIAAPAARPLPTIPAIGGLPGQADSGALFALAFAAADEMAHDAGQPLAGTADETAEETADAVADMAASESPASAPAADTPPASAGTEAPAHLPPQPAPAASATDAVNTPETAAEAPDAQGSGAAQEMTQERAQAMADDVSRPAPLVVLHQAPRHTPKPIPDDAGGQTPGPNSGTQAPGAEHPAPAAALPSNQTRLFGQIAAAPENPAPATPLPATNPPAEPPGASAAQNAWLADALPTALDFAPADASPFIASAAHPGTHAAANAPAQAPLPATHTSAPSAAPSSATTQATVWLHGKNHSAALSLDDGAQPLQVHVRVQGSATHVHFASAQAHTRQWLDSAAGQLRELLGSQGLHLAALSVSAGHSGGAHGSPAHGSAQHTPRHSADNAARPPENNGVHAAADTLGHARTVRLPVRAAGVDFFA